MNAFDEYLSGKDAKPAGNPFDQYLASKGNRTWGEALADIGVSAASGVNSVVESVGTIGGLISGNMNNAVREMGQSGREQWDAKKSLGLQARERARNQTIESGDSELEKAWIAVRETVRDPALLSSFMGEQIPMFVPGVAAGRAAGLIGTAAGLTPKAAGALATATNVGTGAALQGADVAGGAFDRSLKEVPQDLWEQNPDYLSLRDKGATDAEAKLAIGVEIARNSGAQGGLLSILANSFPASRTLERVLSGSTKAAKEGAEFGAKGALKAGAKTAAVEAGTEAIEEGGGQIAANVQLQSLNPNIRTTQGVGEAAGMGALGGGLFGGVAGVVENRAQAEMAKLRSAEAATAAHEAETTKIVTDISKAETVDQAIAAAATDTPLFFDKFAAQEELNRAAGTVGGSASQGEAIPFDYWNADRPALPSPDMPSGRNVLVNDTDPELTRTERFADVETARNAAQREREMAELGLTPDVRRAQANRSPVTLDENGRILEAPQELRALLLATPTINRPTIAEAAAADPAKVSAIATDATLTRAEKTKLITEIVEAVKQETKSATTTAETVAAQGSQPEMKPKDPTSTLTRLGFKGAGPGPGEWVRAVSGLGDVIAKPLGNDQFEVSADYMGRRFATATVSGEAALVNKVNEYSGKINDGRAKMAQLVETDGRKPPTVSQTEAVKTPPLPASGAPLSKKDANKIVGDSAFNGDSASGLESIFFGDEYNGAKIELSSKGFTSEEIAGLERAGMATNGQMSREQFAKYDKERSARLSGKSTLVGAPATAPEKNKKQSGEEIQVNEQAKTVGGSGPQADGENKQKEVSLNERAINRLQQVHDALGTTLKGPVAGAAADIRGAISEMRKPRTAADIKGSLERASERLYAKYKPLAEVIDSIVEDLYPSTQDGDGQQDELPAEMRAYEAKAEAEAKKKALADEIAKIKATRKSDSQSTAPEHAAVGVDDRELGQIVKEFNDAQKSMVDGDEKITHIFDAPKKSEIVNLEKKAGITTKNVNGKRVYNREAGWMTVADARARIDEWKAHAASQGETRANSDRIVLSLFDLTGKWSQPWEDAGYQVYRFDIQDDWTYQEENQETGEVEEKRAGDVNNFGVDFFEQMFGTFEGNDVYAILAACPCTDFAGSGAKHFAAKDADGRTVASVKLVHQTLATIEYFKPAVWALENPVGRIESLGGLPPWRLSFDPYHLGDTYTKKTLIWGRFNADLPIAPVDPVEGSKMFSQYGGKSLATKNARSATPEGFAYGFFMANNAIDHPVMAVANKYDRLDRDLIKRAIESGVTEQQISEAVDDFYYMDLDDDGANDAIRDLIKPATPPKAEKPAIDTNKAPTKNAPAEKSKSAEQMRAEADLMAGLADLADIFGKNTKLNMMEPEQEQKLLPVLTKVFDAAFRLGHIKFKQAAKFVLDTIRAKLGADVADALTLEHLQGAYIGMSGRYKAQGAEGIAAVSSVSDKADIEKSAGEAQNEGTAKEAARDEQDDQPAVGARDTRTGSSPGRKRGARSQQPSPQLDFGDLGAGESKNVGAPESGQTGGTPGESVAGQDVGPSAGSAGIGNAGNGRAGTSRSGNSDAGTGGGSRRPTAGPRSDAPDNRVTPESPAAPPPGDFVITDPLKIVGGGQVARFEKNKTAIELRNRLVEEGRKPTPEEQATLAGYTGWGSFGQELFQGTWDKPAPKAGWEKRDQWLRDNLGKNEWEGMQRSIINAHYTDPPTVLAMWDMVKRMGFKGGRVLEPSIGIGNFFGMMPVELSGRSQRAGIELDPMTGSMAQMLYPSANIQIKGYEASTTPDNFYDLVIGNWPFSEISPADRRYNRLSPTLHDYFFLKAIDQTKPGGLIIGITTKGTMDKKGVGARMEMARKAELIAAFRLPSGAFEEYAGTAVVTDIIILRKRDEPKGMVDKEGWIDVNDHPTKEGTAVPVNEYFHKNPSHVIGEIDFGHGTTTFRPGLIVRRPADMMEQLRRIVDLVPENVFTAAAQAKHISYVANHTSDRTNALVKTDKGLYIVNGEYLAPANEVAKYELKDPAKTAEREKELTALIDMRKLYGRLIDAERTGNAETERKELREAYEAFKKAHGTLSTSFGLGYLRKIDDPFYPSLASLEIRDASDKYRPAGILTASTMRGAKQIDKPTVSDAFVLARNTAVNPTVEQIAEIAKVTPAEAKQQLIAAGAAFELPNGDFAPSDIYLSGNVRAKMREARAALEAGNKEMERNIAALEKVIPADVPYYKIETQMGATWVPASTYADYVAHMLGLESADGIDVTFQGGAWKVQFDSSFNHRPQAQSGFGSPHVKFKRLVRAAIANQTINVKRKDIDGNEYVDDEATKEVNTKISEMRLKFGEWLWSEPTRRLALETEYNEVRNAYAIPHFDGSFLSFQGMALSFGDGPFNLRQHQINAIWRALVTRKSLNAHEVGTGKTFTMGGIAVESRRYGIAKKPMLFAHNANSKSVAHEIQMMYPGAKVLYIDNLSKENIKTRMRQIANDDWDVVVLPHSLIDRIGFKEETLMAMAKEEISDLEIAAEEAAQEDNVTIAPDMWEDDKELAKLRSPTAKQLVKARMKIIETIKKLSQRASQDDSIPFEDMGVDMILVDEAHAFKKPPIATKMQMKGLQKTPSDRSIAMMFLTRYVRSMNNGGNVHLFTGTPITNTMTEVFHMMRYMMMEEMQEAALADWDGWFGSFAREVNDVELNPAGEYEAVTRLQSFINVPELRRMIGQYMDVVFAEDMPEMQLRLVDGKRLTDKDLTEKQRANILNGRTERAKDRPYKKVVNENSDMTPEQNVVFQQVQAWARSWRSMSKKDRKDAMSRGAPESPIIHEGIAAKASFDVRLVRAIENAGKEGSDEMTPHPDSKPARVVKNLLEIYHSDPNANQVVFTNSGIDTSVTRREGPAGAKKDVRYPAFSTVKDMIERLVAAGIPRDQIALVNGATSKDKRKEVADAMNSGKIRIVFGSTESLGVGVNMQRNLRAMHHMDAPYMPGDLEQRNGRGHRQGNQWNTVMEYRYLTDRLDGRRWQILAIKQRFITDFMKSKGEARVIEGDAASDDGGDILSTFSEAAGDPRVLLREKYKKKLEQLQSRERMHTQAMVDAKNTVRASLNSANYYQERLDKLRADGTIAKLQKVIDTTAADAFAMEIGKSRYTVRAEAHDALEKWIEKNVRMGDEKEVGEFGGEPVYAKWSNLQSKPSLYMRFGNDVEVWASPTVASLEASLRHKRKTVETELEKDIADAKTRAAHAKKVANEPFHMADELKAAKKRLDDLVADLEQNPVAAPYWLRAGAPAETEVFRNGNSYIVTGHRWADDGWYVLAKDDKGETAIPYLEATDSQNMPLYEERAFEAPKVQTKGDDKKPMASRGNIKSAGLTIAQARAELVKAFGARGIANLERDSILWIGNYADAPRSLTSKLRGKEEGAYWNGRAYIFADNLSYAEQASSVLLHEIGEHYGLEDMLGAAAYQRLIGQIKALHKAGNVGITTAWNHVKRHYNVEEGSDLFIHEVIAKAGQDGNVQHMSWWKKLIASLKAFLIRKGFKEVSGQADLEALLYASLNKAMRDANEVVPVSSEAMATKDTREPWYSELSRQIKGARLDSMPAQQWKAFIANLKAKGVKNDEIQWSGINEWLDGQTGKVAKADVLDFINQNGVQVEETMLGGRGAEYSIRALDDLVVRADALGYTFNRAEFNDGDAEFGRIVEFQRRSDGKVFQFEGGQFGVYLYEAYGDDTAIDSAGEEGGGGELIRSGEIVTIAEAINQLAVEEQEGVEQDGTRYGNWQLPGGENYRELLLTLPERGNRVDRPEYQALIQKRNAEIERDGEMSPETRAALRAMREQEVTARSQDFRSSHFDQPNILAHVRFNERTDAEGKRVLFIEEIQSDWAQKGKRAGFVDSGAAARIAELTNEMERLAGDREMPSNRIKEEKRWHELAAEREQLSLKLRGVPTAPFVGKTESWVALALKRMIRFAAENGFDRVGFTTGEQQAERYDLSKHVDRVQIWKRPDESFKVLAFRGYEAVMNRNAKDEAAVAELVGKELASKAQKQGLDEKGDYTGLDLKVGGEGMRAFYDKIVPNVANDVLKKLGGGRVGEVDLGGADRGRRHALILERRGLAENDSRRETLSGEIDRLARLEVNGNSTMPQPGFDITPELRAKAMSGMPMFSRMSDQLKGLNRKAADGLFQGEPEIDKPMSPRAVATAFNAIVTKIGRDDLNAILGDWNGSELNEDGDKIIGYPGRDRQFSRGKDGGKVNIPKSEFLDWLGSEAALEVSDAKEWRDMIEAARVAIGAPMASRGNSTVRDMWDLARSAKTPAQARDMALNILDDPNQLSLWDKTLGTQLNKARKNRYFRKVFDVLQRQQDDVAAFAIEAEAEAADVLARMNDRKEIASSLKASLSGQRAKDLDVVSKAIFSKIAGVEGVNQKVYTDEELTRDFGMNERQIGMYRQSRDAIDRSLDRYAQSVAVKIAQKYVATDDLRRATLDDSVSALVERLNTRIETLESMVDEDPGEILRSLTVDEKGQTRQDYVRIKPEEANNALSEEIDGLKAAIKKMTDLQEQAQKLKDAGYAPAMRFGNYSVTARSYDPRTGESTVEYFGMSDTKTGANVTKMMLKKDHPGWDVVVSPVDKESFKLFRGISPDTVELFARFMDVEQDAAFKEYIALATSSRSAMKRMLERKGVAGFSDNLPRVLSAFITSNSRAAAENMNGFDINEALEAIPQNQGDVSAEAAKLVDYLRNPTDDGAKIRGFMFAYFMGGSVASALVNITQPVMMTAPYLSQFAGLKTPKIMTRAGKMAATGKVEGRDLKAAFDRAEAEGVTDSHEYHQLMQEAEGGGSVAGRAVMKSWGAMFGATEKFNRRITFLAAFEVAQGMTPAALRKAGYDNAYDFAKGAVAETQGIYNKANRPNWARGQVGALLLTFKQFSIAYLEFFNRLPMQQKMLALAMLILAAGLEGLPFADDLEDLIDTIGQKMGYATNSKKELRKAAVSLLGEAGAEFALRGITGLSGVPMDVSGRLGMGNLIPGTRMFNPSAKDKGREVAEVLGAAGGVAQKAMSAVDQGKVREAMPKAVSDAAKAYEMIATGEYRDSKGRKVIATDSMDAAMKLIGFQPRDVADANRRIGEQMRDSDTVKRVESEIVDQWADGVRNKKPEQVQEARDRLRKWNEDNPDFPIRIKLSQVANRIKFANMTRDQRFQKTLTPEMRSQILRERIAA